MLRVETARIATGERTTAADVTSTVEPSPFVTVPLSVSIVAFPVSARAGAELA